MKRLICRIMLISIFINPWQGIFGQPKGQLVDQKPNVAGQFYPGSKTELTNMLKDLFSRAIPSRDHGDVLAVISPHAGYVFSGKTAASAFSQINPEKEFKTIFIIGSSHQMHFEGAAIYDRGNFITPLGVVKVNLPLASRFVQDNQVFSSKPEAFRSEHSLEVQLPFLQYRLKKEFQIIPIIIGTQDPRVCRSIADALMPYFNQDHLFVISSDFSHYPSYQNAYNVDRETAEAIRKKSPEEFYAFINSQSDRLIPNLATRACAWTSILTLLYMAEKSPGTEINMIDYSNSGDSELGDRIRVVGYHAISFTLREQNIEKPKTFFLEDSDKKILLDIARKSIETYLTRNRMYDLGSGQLSNELRSPAGAFVTLHIHDKLRGCIGRLSGDMPLCKVVQEMAVAAAIHDYRFDKVSLNELKDIEIEISVLSPLKKIRSIEEIQPGKHGIYIKKGPHSGTYLPQVASDTGWSREELLGHCAKEKAMIGWDGWKDSEIFIYEAYVFSEKELLK